MGVAQELPIDITLTATEDVSNEITTTLSTFVENVPVNCKQDDYLMVPYRSLYVYIGVMVSVFVLIAIVLIVICVVHKRRRFSLRHGEYKLTTMRKTLPDQEKASRSKNEDMYQ